MRVATLDDGTRDGALVVVSADHTRAVPAPHDYATLQQALDDWERAAPRLAELARRLDTGTADAMVPFESCRALAPLPRSYQWLDGSAYRSHGQLMAQVFGIDNPQTGRPLMYQGMSHEFLGPGADVPLPSEDDGIDFEGEFGVITDAVPMGVSSADAEQHIRLVMLINDWSLRTLAPIEMKTGFGWVQAKPACSAAPVAVTPDELGAQWQDARVHLRLETSWNDRPFGSVDGSQMEFGFGELVAHAARTRRLCAGTIVGSGTVSNPNYREVGSSCVEPRAVP